MLMDISGGLMFNLNPVGSIIWQQLSEGCSLEQIAIRLATDFGIPREQALADVNEFVQQLETQHLLNPSDSEDSRPKPEPSLKGLVCNLFRWGNAQASDRPPAK